jgi:hypothetical protein
MAEKKKKHAGHGFKHTHIEHHKDRSATVHHQHEDGSHADVKHAAANLDGIHDSLEQHLGQPNDGEGQMPSASVAATQAPIAAPAGIPGGLPGAGA